MDKLSKSILLCWLLKFWCYYYYQKRRKVTKRLLSKGAIRSVWAVRQYRPNEDEVIAVACNTLSHSIAYWRWELLLPPNGDPLWINGEDGKMSAVAYTHQDSRTQSFGLTHDEASSRFNYRVPTPSECLHHYLENNISISQLMIQLQHHFNVSISYLTKALSVSPQIIQCWSNNRVVKPTFSNYCKVLALHRLIKELNRTPHCSRNSDHIII